MIHSTNEYNLHPAHGIILSGKAVDYRKSSEIDSIAYPNYSYHYEFWIHSNGNLYACLHCTHKKPHAGLISFIDTLFIPVIGKSLTRNGFTGITRTTLTGLSGAGSTINTHVINIVCLKHGAGYEAHNAKLMWHLIDVTYGKI
jgi:hypothetical protein